MGTETKCLIAGVMITMYCMHDLFGNDFISTFPSQNLNGLQYEPIYIYSLHLRKLFHHSPL